MSSLTFDKSGSLFNRIVSLILVSCVKGKNLPRFKIIALLRSGSVILNGPLARGGRPTGGWRVPVLSRAKVGLPDVILACSPNPNPK